MVTAPGEFAEPACRVSSYGVEEDGIRACHIAIRLSHTVILTRQYIPEGLIPGRMRNRW
ncbi:hypothetical protein JDM601_2070 [Mycolicibacter sinensis]|uniref:Uncharacterized protein n=1 Tax=Mycolicibacter sinensis (strain JDM601) TaxID=875328 RepID=F5YSR8_MYCSD|nr:hypothetical protein JDM601_2070 [Mycolicibacter sinensis]